MDTHIDVPVQDQLTSIFVPLLGKAMQKGPPFWPSPAGKLGKPDAKVDSWTTRPPGRPTVQEAAIVRGAMKQAARSTIARDEMSKATNPIVQIARVIVEILIDGTRLRDTLKSRWASKEYQTHGTKAGRTGSTAAGSDCSSWTRPVFGAVRGLTVFYSCT